MMPVDADRISVARGFLQRLMGVHGPLGRGGVVWFPGCRVVHTLWTRRPLWLVFMAKDGRVLSQRLSRSGRVFWCWDADSVLEIDPQSLPAAMSVGVREAYIMACRELCLRFNARGVYSRPSGMAMLEALIAAPLVLLLGLMLLQITLLAYGRLVVGYAAAEATRAAASAQISASAIDGGLSRGLTPLLGLSARDGVPGSETIASAAMRTRFHYLRGKAEGWIDWTLLSPTTATLEDWGKGTGRVVSPALWHSEAIPAPRSGVSGMEPLTGLAVGRSSGQTFLDAGVIRLEVSVGLPLHVPLAGPILARTVAWWRGCSLSGAMSLGSLRLKTPFAHGAVTATRDSAGFNECRLLLGPSMLGVSEKMPARLPVRVVSVAQSQTVFSSQTLPAR
ncbi:MAG: hypothetical protein FJY35_08805 [Betaproteobacteria bacterium]|nr:hypothetical protein [Betaproteobacteria bacterium]